MAPIRRRLQWGCPCRYSAQVEDGSECLVDSPEFLGSQVAHQIAKATGVNPIHLLHEDASRNSVQSDLRPERCRAGASRCGRDE